MTRCPGAAGADCDERRYGTVSPGDAVPPAPPADIRWRTPTGRD